MKKIFTRLAISCQLLSISYAGFAQTTVNFSQENAVQNWTIPAGVTTLTVTAIGGQGGGNGSALPYTAGGFGASVTGICTVTPGHKISIAVGAEGGSGTGTIDEPGGGGGGTFVYDSNTGTLYVVAGGGGGEGFNDGSTGQDGAAAGTNVSTYVTTSSTGGSGAGRTGGNGGHKGSTASGNAPGAAGAGWISNGDSVGAARDGDGGNPSTSKFNGSLGGSDKANGFIGGTGMTDPSYGFPTAYGTGGYGGGGGGGWDAAGGGGGYNGGGGGNDINYDISGDCIDDVGGGGGGGGSYLNGTVVGSPIATHLGNGSASIKYIAGAALSTTASVTTNVTCYGGTNGSASASPSGGTSPYTYSWTPTGGSNVNGTGLIAGSYTVTVTDATSATATASVLITQPTVVAVSVSSNTGITCNGGTSSATLSTTGGTSPYTYSWSPIGGNAATGTGLTAGTYTITVTDHNGCSPTSTTMVTVTQPAVVAVSVSSNTGITCNGGTSSATLSTTGGTSPYTYSWSPIGGNAATGTGLTAGTYTITVTDHNGCSPTSTTMVTVTQPTVVAVSVSSNTGITCNGGTSSATLSTTGGTSPYTYSWSPIGGNAATGTGLTAGTYTITVTDHNGCSPTSTTMVTVTQPTVVAVSVSSNTGITCNGGTSSATLSTTGGTSPYTYSWSPIGGNAATGTGLTAGTYTITVTDHNGCSPTSTTTVTVTQPAVVAVSVSSNTGITCNGGTSSATLSTTGGTSPYTYSWSPIGGNAATGTGLTAGTYTITVTDHNGCASTSTTMVTVTQPTVVAVSVSSNTGITCNGGTSSATLSTTGGTSPYTYSWSPIGGNAATGTGLTAGTYTITVTDHNGCSPTSTTTVTVTQPATLSASANTTANVTCNSTSAGSALVSLSGGTSPYVYLWNDGNNQTTAAATGLSAGTYTVTVTDACGGDLATASVIITQPTALSVSANITASVSCNNGSNGSASSTLSGGTAPYTYSWNDGNNQTTAAATGLSAGTYTVTVTDACAGDLATAGVIITQPTALSVSANITANVSCNGNNNGSASATVTGGTIPYTYLWSDGSSQTTASASGLTAGTYTVSVHDNNGCNSIATVAITQPTLLSASANTTANVTCYSGTNGSASSTVSGGTLPYTYSWTGGAGNNATASGLSAGTYTLSIQDNNGCTSSASVIITQPAVLSISAISINNVSCNGGNNGSASFMANGGSSPYTYSWTGGAGNNATATGLTAGTYTLTVTDICGDLATARALIVQPSVLNASANLVTNVSCHGGSNGSASAAVSGGTSPYTYSWSGGAGSNANAIGLTAGTYTLTVRDACGGDLATASVTITQPPALSLSANTTANITCNSTAQGSASATVSGGTLPYTYSWTAGAGSSSTATGLTAGTYTITVKDICGAAQTASIIITQPPILTVSTNITGTITCNGNATGSISSGVSGGTLPYTYSWTGGAGTNSSASGLTAGTYTLTITDACGGDLATTSVIISQPAVLSASANATANVTCNGNTNGSISAAVSGGTLPYTYSWTGGAGTNATASGLGAGTYTVTVTDACGGDLASASVVITQPDVLNALASIAANVTCNNGNDGSASSTVSGGTLPYTYLWSDGSSQTTATATGLNAGTYTLSVTDNNGCSTTTNNVIITQPNSLSASATTTTNVTCNNGNDGSASSTISGGTAPYTYAWNDGNSQSTAIASGLSAGTYTVTVTDACSGDLATASIIITQPNSLSASAATTTNVTCNNGNDGSASSTVSGGTLPYTYSWSDGNSQTTVTATGLSAGTYTLSVTDACGGDLATVSVIISQPAVLIVSTNIPANVTCTNGNDGSASSTISGGTAPYTYAWNDGNSQTTVTATGLSAGTYTVTVTDACSGDLATASVIITQPNPLSVSANTTANVTCYNGNDGSASSAISGGTAPYTYAWNDGNSQSTATASGLSAGAYTVTVTDACGGDLATASIIITQPNSLSVLANTTANVTCYNGTTGSASSTVSGGTLPYTYTWSDGNSQSTTTASGLSAGTYTITVTDACGGDLATASIIITQPNSLSVSANTTANVTCYNGTTGSASSTVSGGTLPYTYAWSDGNSQTTVTATGLSAGTYTLTITDACGADLATASVIITQPAALSASANVSAAITCYGGNTGSASSIVSGGTSPYTYSWTGGAGTNSTANGLTAGTYTLTVTDACGGDLATASVIITQPAVLSASASIISEVSCHGSATGSASSTVSGGTAPYTYSWTGGAGTNATATGLNAGTYILIVSDACGGDLATASVVLTQPSVLSAFASTTANLSCYGTSTGSISSTVTGGISPYTYSWTGGAGTNATASGLSAGIYTLTVIDETGCSTTASTSITQPIALSASASTTTNVTCYNGTTGSASATVSGGNSPYTYSWTGGAGTNATATGLSSGTYTLTVTDACGGYSATAFVVITQPTALSASANVIANVSCFGGSANGSASATVSGGTSPYTYSWTGGAGTNATATGLSVGGYTVTVTDACGGDLATASVIITQPGVLSASANTINNVGCNGSNNGSASANISGGTSPYTYSWTGGAGTNATATGLSAGTYTLTVTDICGGDLATASVVITQPTVLSASATTTANATCSNGNNGSISSAISGGTAPYTYSWTGGAGTNATATGLSAGTYIVNVTDQNGCSVTASATITQPAILNASTNIITNVTCRGGNTGGASSTVSGGTAPYTYSWTGGAGTNATATGLSAGTYTLTVTDACGGDLATASVIITQPATLSASANTTANVSCNGSSTGSASSIVSGGTAPYTYSWTGGVGTNATATGLKAGTYTLTVTDACGGDLATASVIITQPATLSASANTTANVSCNGSSTGSASSTISGGTAPYTYSWTGGAGTNATATGLKAGTYTLTVTDACGGDLATASVIITQPATLSASANTTANVSCNGSSTGSASSTISGGTAPYTYSWTGGAGTNATATGLKAGTYTLTVTDACGGDVATASVIITQPAALSASANTTANVSCNGSSTGSASSTISGGTAPYTYSWTGGAGTNATATGLKAGTYTLTVTDACGGDVATASVIITQPAALSASANTTANVSCNGSSTGSASSTISGGTAPYTYSWTGGAGTNATATGLSAGTYTLTVKDACGSSQTAFAIITQPGNLNVSAHTTANVSCNGNNNGSASSTVSGGTLSYTYSWTGGAGTNATATGLSAGTYTLTVKDACGSSQTAFAIITQPGNLNVSAHTTTNVSCNGSNNGSASSTVSGGTLPYTYSWTGGAGSNATATGLDAGTYTLTLKDACGSSQTATAIITQPAALKITVDSVSDSKGCNGSAGVTVSGGTSPYTYTWTPGSETTASISNLCSGTYTCTVTDNSGCDEKEVVIIKNTTGIESISNSSSVNIYPNPTLGNFTVDGVSQGQVITIYDYLGQELSSITVENNTTMHFDISTRTNGIYLVRIQNSDGTIAAQKKIVKTR